MPNQIPTRPLQGGGALVEWTLIALPLLLVGSLALEVSEWHLTRQRLALVLQRATEDTALKGGHPQTLLQQVKRHWPSHLMAKLHACVTEPRTLLADFADRSLSRMLGQSVVRHDHLAHQHAKALKKGWPQGRGRTSGRTIFEANVLTVQAYASIQPRSVWIRAIVPTVTMKIQAQAIMQSHRVAWQSACGTIHLSRRGLTVGAGAELPSLGRI